VSPDANQSFTLTVDAAPAITSGNNATFTATEAGSFTVTSTGNPTAALSESGSLPSGVSFTDNGDGTATLGGTPAAGTDGTYSLTIDASNGVSPDASQSFTLTVNPAPEAPAITSADNATFAEGSAGSFTVTSTGNPTAALSETGALPTGVSFVDNGDSTANLAGTPAAGTAGTYSLTIDATNGVSPDASQTFTLTVDAAPAITSDNATTFTEGSAGSFTVTSTGNPTAALSASGGLPSGVTFVDDGDGTATLAGTPAAGSGGIYTLDFSATNGVGSPATQSFTLTVDSAPAFTSAGDATFVEGSAGNFTVTATGTPAPTIAESGTLPTGLGFTGGVLSGTPAAGTAGTTTVSFTATNGIGSPATQSFTQTVDAAAAITSAAATTFNEGVAGNFTVTATGYPAPTITEVGVLPHGVSFTGGVLSGTPTQSGTYEISFIAHNGVGTDDTQSFLLTVNGLHVTTTSLATLTEGTPYTQQLAATGGVTPLKWKKVGKLPKGLKLSKAGVLSGTVSASKVAPGTYTVNVKVTDSTKPKAQTATASLTLTVVS
jgi:hypothetical protein